MKKSILLLISFIFVFALMNITNLSYADNPDKVNNTHIQTADFEMSVVLNVFSATKTATETLQYVTIDNLHNFLIENKAIKIFYKQHEYLFYRNLGLVIFIKQNIKNTRNTLSYSQLGYSMKK